MIKLISHKVSLKNCFENCAIVHYQTREVGLHFNYNQLQRFDSLSNSFMKLILVFRTSANCSFQIWYSKPTWKVAMRRKIIQSILNVLHHFLGSLEHRCWMISMSLSWKVLLILFSTLDQFFFWPSNQAFMKYWLCDFLNESQNWLKKILCCKC
jgi:hypothetical protein